MDSAEWIWMDGKLQPWADCTVHVGTHALHYGTGVFEGVRAYETPRGAGIVRLADHLTRFERSAGMYRMEMPYAPDELAAATWSLLEANNLDAAYIRPIAWRGYRQLGLYPRDCPVQVAIMAWPWGAYLGEDGITNGIRATVSSWRRFSANVMPPRAKASGHYLNSALAKMDAVQDGYDEAILLNEAGLVAEGTSENVFVVKDGAVATPRLTDSILDGITRDIVITICRDLDIPIAEQAVERHDLTCCDELFLTGTAAEITPVREIDGHRLGEPGPVTRRLQRAYFDTINGLDTPWASMIEYAPEQVQRPQHARRDAS